MPLGLKGHSTGDSIRHPCFQLMQSYSVNTAPVLYLITLLIAVAFERALLKPKYPKGRLASLMLTQDVGRAYHLFAILTVRTFTVIISSEKQDHLKLFFLLLIIIAIIVPSLPLDL